MAETERPDTLRRFWLTGRDRAEGLAHGSNSAYLGPMSRFRKLNPAPGFLDFWEAFRQPTPYRWPALIISLAITGTMLYAIGKDRVYSPPERPTVNYITSFTEGRSDAEIIASNEANQKRQDALEAAREARLERRREAYRALGRATGMDVDKIEREAREAEAAEKAALEARLEQRKRLQQAQEAENPAQ